MDWFKVTASVVLVLLYFQLSEANTANCTALKKCQTCLDYNETTCFWCQSGDGKCIKKEGFLPKGCNSLDWRSFGSCAVPGYVWFIVFPVLGFLFLVSLMCGFYCFCCRGKRTARSMDREETKFHRKRMELKAKHDERRAERKLRTDEIRKKYGLNKEDGSSSSSRYQQFNNEAEA